MKVVWNGDMNCFFDRKTTNVLKGVLLILMFVLHFFCFPSWYIKEISYPRLFWMESFQGHFQICIAGFTFLTGYLYYFSGNKDLRYIIRKWKEILIPYWIVLFLLLFVAILTGTYVGKIKNILLEILALEHSVMYFCWYVSYYLLMIILLGIMIDFFKNDLILWGGAVIGSYLIYYLAVRSINVTMINSVLEKFYVYFPMTITGYLCAKRRLFEKIKKIFDGKRGTRLFFSIIFVIIVFMEPTWLYRIQVDSLVLEIVRKCIRIISIPFFVYGIIEIIESIYNEKCKRIIEAIGEKSMIMWFVHCVFFNCSKEVFQKFLYIPKQPIVVVAWGLFICYCIAIPIDIFSKKIIRKLKFLK